MRGVIYMPRLLLNPLAAPSKLPAKYCAAILHARLPSGKSDFTTRQSGSQGISHPTATETTAHSARLRPRSPYLQAHPFDLWTD
jgi:hypothetical protein